MEALGFNFLTILVYTIQFVILFFLLKMLAYGPISNMLETRKQTIAEGLAAAEKAQQEAAQQRAQFDKELGKAREASLADAQKEAEATRKMRDEIIDAAKKEAEDIKVRAKEEAEQERQQLAADLQRQTAELAMQITRKVVGEAIDEQAQRKLTDQFLASLGDA
ncbi:F0F1 ATP synthase subunit B [Anaerolineales bacterium HSG25]|nr:F0F1 ATP synthase subunit B [Anaerolineales bacterium HSG25]